MNPDYKIGCSGFYNKHWKGIFYPEDLAQKNWLNFYAENLKTLELNNTFYRFPTLKIMQNWYNKVPEGFLFSVKVPKIITHLNKLQGCEKLLDDFYGICKEGLQEKLACVLFQFPPGISYNEIFLEKILQSLKPGFKNVVEFRHQSWWTQKVYDALAERNITFCCISHPSLPDTMNFNTQTAYIRFHGKRELFYSEYSLSELYQLQKDISKNKTLEEVYIYFNNTASTAGIVNARQFQKITNSGI